MKYNIHILSFLFLITVILTSCEEKIEEPQLEIIEAKYITHVSAMIVIKAPENDEVDYNGICWATHPNPSMDDSYNGLGQLGLGTDEWAMFNLEFNTVYYVKAYTVKKDNTIKYSEEFKIKTLDGNIFSDPRDGQKYPTVQIGTQIWMAENLRYDAPGSAWYNNDPEETQFGKYYDWKTACDACPSGWRLPDDEDWKQLSSTLGTPIGLVYSTGRYSPVPPALTMPISSWNIQMWPVNNASGFSALAAGSLLEGQFVHQHDLATFWSKTNDQKAASVWIIANAGEFYAYRKYKEAMYSVRCIKE